MKKNGSGWSGPWLGSDLWDFGVETTFLLNAKIFYCRCRSFTAFFICIFSPRTFFEFSHSPFQTGLQLSHQMSNVEDSWEIWPAQVEKWPLPSVFGWNTASRHHGEDKRRLTTQHHGDCSKDCGAVFSFTNSLCFCVQSLDAEFFRTKVHPGAFSKVWLNCPANSSFVTFCGRFTMVAFWPLGTKKFRETERNSSPAAFWVELLECQTGHFLFLLFLLDVWIKVHPVFSSVSTDRRNRRR